MAFKLAINGPKLSTWNTNYLLEQEISWMDFFGVASPKGGEINNNVQHNLIKVNEVMMKLLAVTQLSKIIEIQMKILDKVMNELHDWKCQAATRAYV